MGDQFSAQSNGDCAGWEGVGGNCLVKDREGIAEGLVLRAGVAHQEGEAGGRILGRSQSRIGRLIGL